MFRLVWFGTPSDVTSEANDGRGPADFKVSRGAKDKTIVEYALKESNKPIGVATYQIVTAVPQSLQGELPSPEQIMKLLEGIEP